MKHVTDSFFKTYHSFGKANFLFPKRRKPTDAAADTNSDAMMTITTTMTLHPTHPRTSLCFCLVLSPLTSTPTIPPSPPSPVPPHPSPYSVPLRPIRPPQYNDPRVPLNPGPYIVPPLVHHLPQLPDLATNPRTCSGVHESTWSWRDLAGGASGRPLSRQVSRLSHRVSHLD